MVTLPAWLPRLLGISTYSAENRNALALPSLDSAQVEEARAAYGGQIVPIPQTRTRWLIRDVESAQANADTGDLWAAAKLWQAARGDGVLAGVLSTRTNGLVQLPKRWRGDPDVVSRLELGHDSIRSVFDEMCPPAELAQLLADGIGLGVGVAELLPVPGRSYPVLCRLPVENLVYRWAENRWYYRSIVGMIPVTPGDRRWVLHVPGGRVAPWQQGMWRPIGRAYVDKEHARLHDSNWQAKLANPARVAVAPNGATDEQHASWFAQVMAWGVNTVFGMKPGYDVRLLESNGRGSEAFDRMIKRAEREYVIGISGQEVTTDGGAGFANTEVHKAIRADLIKGDGDALAYTINTQVIPPWVVSEYGEEALERSPQVAWDTSPPKDRRAEADAAQVLGQAIKLLSDALATHGYVPDVREMCERAGVPIAAVKAAVPQLREAA